MDIKGKVIEIGKVTSGTSKSGNDWQKQDVLIEETSEKYPNSALITFFNKEIDFKAGDEININFNIKANEFKGRHFNNLTAFKWETITQGGNGGDESNDDVNMPSAPMPGQSDFTQGTDNQIDLTDMQDDLPF